MKPRRIQFDSGLAHKEKRMEHLFSIDLPYGNFGIVTDDNRRVVEAAPMGKWMVGKYIAYITNWVKKKGGTIQQVY